MSALVSVVDINGFGASSRSALAGIGLALLAACGTPEASSAGGEGGTELTRTPPELVVFVYDRSTIPRWC